MSLTKSHLQLTQPKRRLTRKFHEGSGLTVNSSNVLHTVPSSNRWLSPGLSIGLDYGRELWLVHSFESAGKSDRTPFRTRHEYIHVGSDASSLTHTVLKEVRSLFPARARLRREKPPA